MLAVQNVELGGDDNSRADKDGVARDDAPDHNVKNDRPDQAAEIKGRD